eukprot:scpid106048/ scgid27525/ 
MPLEVSYFPPASSRFPALHKGDDLEFSKNILKIAMHARSDMTPVPQCIEAVSSPDMMQATDHWSQLHYTVAIIEILRTLLYKKPLWLELTEFPRFSKKIRDIIAEFLKQLNFLPCKRMC